MNILALKYVSSSSYFCHVLRFKTSNKIYRPYVTQISILFFFFFEKKITKYPTTRTSNKNPSPLFLHHCFFEEFHHSIQLGSLYFPHLHIPSFETYQYIWPLIPWPFCDIFSFLYHLISPVLVLHHHLLFHFYWWINEVFLLNNKSTKIQGKTTKR